MPEPDSFEIADVADGEAWDAFVGTAAGATVFSTSAWLRCAREATGCEPRIHGCYRRGELVAAVSGLHLSRRLRSQLVTPPLLPHGGLLHRPVDSDNPARRESARNSSASSLIRFLESSYSSVRLTHSPELVDMREFSWAGWDVGPRYTYRLPLPADRQELWQQLERRTRTVVRKAEKEGYRFRRLDDPELLRRQYELVYSSSIHGRRPPVESALVERFARAAADAGLTEMHVAESPSGAIAAAVVFARGSHEVFAWVAGADPAFRDSGAASFLYWKFLEQTAFQRFDFVGANIPGIALFKRGFAGDLVPYFHTQGYRSRWLQGLTSLRAALRR